MTGSLSTRRLDLLPSPDGLLRLSKALTILDRIMEPERPELRYFDFHEDWGGGSLATMDSGEGDYYRIWFLRAGTVVCGLDPSVPYSRVEAAQRTAEVFSALPPALSRARIEFDDVTFACHRARKDTVWVATPTRRRGKDPDGSERVLRFLDDHPETYVRHARTYFGRKVALPAVRKAYELTLDAATVSSLNDATSPRSILAFARRLGFEVAAGRATATISLPPAEVRKSLAQLADPASLAKRLAFMFGTLSLLPPLSPLLPPTGFRSIHPLVRLPSSPPLPSPPPLPPPPPPPLPSLPLLSPPPLPSSPLLSPPSSLPSSLPSPRPEQASLLSSETA